MGKEGKEDIAIGKSLCITMKVHFKTRGIFQFKKGMCMYLLTNSKCMKQRLTELKKETDKSIIIVGDFRTPIELLLERLRKKSYVKNLQYYQII